ncbi:hypothetical protein BP6252_11470 [Coleophoma cylindrospora]|uniref:DUF4185 domain-containing protein n=1 Tax=Coleophoma cylindrospora TaxID=1849047 RepID=A0A3D8QJW2_9HELO|nr:hypothetical protein BP6252_11470 [Coleophoma cylindrospora]
MHKILENEESKMDSLQQSSQSKRYGPSARIAWPPKVESINMLGEIKDTNGRNTPRDLGRSITLGGHQFYMFADTFCFDDAGQFVGLTSNTCAYIPDTNRPTVCSYWHTEPREPEFIPMTPEDDAYNKEKKGTYMRVANWAFGGVIEDGLDEYGKGGNGKGWIFNDRVLIQDKGSVGMELVRVELQDGHRIHAEKVPGLSPFGEKEVRVGSIDTFIDGGWVYLIGGAASDSQWPARNVMARIKYGDDLSQISNYQYHTTADGWKSNFDKVEELSDVLAGIGQGMIFKVDEDHAPQGKPYMCIGVDKFMSNGLYLGVAEKPEGPWELKNVGQIPKFLHHQSNTRYCLYMHSWGSDLSQGELLVSWSDDGQMGGLVVAAKLRLHMDEEDLVTPE